MTCVFLGLGSNLEHPHTQLSKAISALRTLPQSELKAVASVYSSSPVGPPGQPDYLNTVARIDTSLTPLALLDHLQAIESAQGRERAARWGPRTLDIDILLFGDEEIESSRLTIPHPRLPERDFVLQPLKELMDENQVLPNGTDLDTLLANCQSNNLVRTDLHL